jgi:hypothetical protein
MKYIRACVTFSQQVVSNTLQVAQKCMWIAINQKISFALCVTKRKRWLLDIAVK